MTAARMPQARQEEHGGQRLTRGPYQASSRGCNITFGDQGMEPLYSEKYHEDDQSIAAPVLRFHVWISGTFADALVRAAAGQAAEAFMDHLGDSAAFGALVRPTGAKSLRLTRAQKGRQAEMASAVASGLPDHRYLYLTGTDADGKPDHPLLALAHAPLPMAEIRVELPWQADGALELMADIDAALAGLPVIAGYTGYGFAPRPLGVNYASFAPPAHLRYRCALMMDPVPFSPLVRHDQSYVTMRRLDQKRAAKGQAIDEADLFDYAPGLPDIGWRTHVGGAFRDRLAPTAEEPGPGVTIGDRGTFTTVTAGPAPIWGALDPDEDISAYRTAFGHLEPAMCDRNMRVRFAPGHSLKDRERARQAMSYVDRFKVAEVQA